MSTTAPHYTDGRVAILDPYLAILNFSPVKLLDYMSDSIDREAVEQEYADSDGSPLGSDTREGFQKGSISFQYNLASDAVLRPGHTLLLNVGRGDEYYVAGKPGEARTRNQMVRGSVAVKRLYNPVFTSLLSSDLGQSKTLTQAAGALAGDLAAAPTVVNLRSGSTKVFSVAAAPGSTLPGWLSCDTGTGALSGTAVAGTFNIDHICTETLAGQPTRIGFGRLVMVIT